MSRTITNHAARRMSQRGLTAKTIALVMQWGREINERAAWHIFLGKKEVAQAARHGVDLRKAQGTHLFCDNEGRLITTYKDHHPRGR